MDDRNSGAETPLRVWRRSTARPAAVADEPRLYGGGPDRTVEEIYQEMKALKRERDAERERQKAEAEAEAAEKKDKKKQGEDDDAAVERFRNDRYAVGLLRQDTNTWGVGPDYSGTLG